MVFAQNSDSISRSLNCKTNDSIVFHFKTGIYCVLYLKDLKVKNYTFHYSDSSTFKADTTVFKDKQSAIHIKVNSSTQNMVSIFLDKKGKHVFVHHLEKNKLSGKSYIYDSEGQIRLLNNYYNNFEQGEQLFFKNGKLRRQALVDQVRNPKTLYIKLYYDTGQLESYMQFSSSGRIDENYFSNGILSSVKNYDSDGRYHGIQKKFDKKGECVLQQTYEHGILVEEGK